MMETELVWTEKYRPRRLSEMVDREEIVKRLETFVKTKNMPHLLFVGPPGTSKTTSALALVYDMYNGNVSGNYIELNASDERGIDVIRNRVKEFARSVPLGDVPFKIIILDECDSTTEEAQQALRRTMERYSSTTRFILIANELYKIIEPIQSRCAVFRFGPLPDSAILERLKEIATKENIKYEEEALRMIVEKAEGDMRKAINFAQGAAAIEGAITVKSVKDFIGYAGVGKIDQVFEKAFHGDLEAAVSTLNNLLYNEGIPPKEIIRGIHKNTTQSTLSAQEKADIVAMLADVEYRIHSGADPEIQISALLAKISTLSADKRKKQSGS